MLLAQTLFAQIAGLSIGQILIIIIVLAGCIAIVAVILKQLNVTLPSWFLTVLLIVVTVVVGAIAVKFLLSLL